MIKQDRQRFSDALKNVELIHKETRIDQIIPIYFNLLKQFTIEDVELGLAKCLTTINWFPKPPQIIDAINGDKLSLTQQADVAWMEVMTLIGSTGSYRVPKFSDNLIVGVINSLGGWQKLCSLSTKQLDFTRKEFTINFATVNTLNTLSAESAPVALLGTVIVAGRGLESKTKALQAPSNTMAASQEKLSIESTRERISQLRGKL